MSMQSDILAVWSNSAHAQKWFTATEAKFVFALSTGEMNTASPAQKRIQQHYCIVKIR